MTTTAANVKGRRRRRIFERLGCLLIGIMIERLSTGLLLDSQESSPTLQTMPKVQVKQHKKQDRHQPSSAISSRIKFLFVIGLEGTGHHFMGQIFKGSPVRQTLKERHLEDYRVQLHNALFLASTDADLRLEQKKMKQKVDRRKYSKGKGLWDAHCSGKNTNTTLLQATLIHLLDQMNQNVATTTNTASTTRQQQHSFRGNNNNEDNDDTGSVIVFPINTIVITGGYGEVSYPNFGHPCRPLNYPNLDLWYDHVCSQVEAVDCEHVYIYRDPVAILRSTTVSRPFNPTLLSGIHLYETMLHVVYSQLHTYKRKTIGCFGLTEATTTTTSLPDWWEEIRILGGWAKQPKQEFDNYMHNLYKPHEPTSASFLSQDYDLYMKPLKQLHDRVVHLCQDSLVVA